MKYILSFIICFGAVMFSLQGQTTQSARINITPTAFVKSRVDQKMGEWLRQNPYASDANKAANQKQFENEAIAEYKETFLQTANWHDMQIAGYDQNTQAFLIKSGACADFMVPVPNPEAREFEEEFQTSKLRIANPDFQIEGDVVRFSKLTFITSKGKRYNITSNFVASNPVTNTPVTNNLATNNPTTNNPTTNNLVTNNPALATITWKFPLVLRVDTYKSDLNIQACVKSESQIKNASVLINGQATRGIQAVVNDGCDLSVNENIILAKGMNEVKIVIENDAGKSVSDVCYVNYATRAPDVYYRNNKRLALVIGNSAYENFPLANPANDAIDLSAKLKKLGFDVVLLTDRTKEQMINAIDKFGGDAKNYDVALFFYAGHAVQHDGKNYLIPVDMPPLSAGDERKIEFDCIPMDRVLANMEYSKCKLKLIILDACRDNFTRSLTGTGLLPMTAPKGTFIAYSTSPGAKALDGTGRNSPYTAELLKRIDTKGLKIEELFKQVREGVLERTNGQQLPWDQSSIIGDFSFSD